MTGHGRGTGQGGTTDARGRWGAARVVAAGIVSASFAGLVGCGGGGSTGNTVLPGVQAMVFVQRAYVNADGTENVSGGSRQVIDYQRYVPGGGVYVLEPPTPDGRRRSLTEGYEGVDIAGLDLSFDAREVVFSMRHSDDEHYHLYLAPLDGSTSPRQITDGPYDDLRPIYVPGDRIAYITNQQYADGAGAFGPLGLRADEYEHSREVTQLAIINTNGGDPTLCAQNLSHTADPFLLSDGQIGYSRWEHLGPVNDVKLFRVNPDCTGMEAIAGQFNKQFNSIVQATEIEPGVFAAIGTSRSRTLQSGAVIRIDARAQNGLSPLLIDVQQATFTNLTPLVPLGSEPPPSTVGRYRHPRPLGSRYLVSWSDGDVNDRNELAQSAPEFGIYLYDPTTERRTLVYDDPAHWDLYAIPVAPRNEPPVVRPGVTGNVGAMYSEPAILGGIDVAETSLDEQVSGGQFADGMGLHDALLQTRRMRIIEGFSSEIGGVGQFGLTMHEGAAIVGETTVHADGSWRAAVPAYLPYHLQPLDRFGMAIRNQMLWIQAMPGESRQCGGCHSSRSREVVPRMGATTIAQQIPPDMTTLRQIPDRMEIPWAGATRAEANLQTLFDNHCSRCHDGGASDPYRDRYYTVSVTPEGATEELTFRIPWLDLSNRPIDTYYEREVVSYPASYVSLLYPSAMMGEMDIVPSSPEAMPVEWVVPGSARHSRVVEAVNIEAEDDANVLAFQRVAGAVLGARHPEDVGETLTREERMLLIRMADLGGQYWSRQNVDSSAEWSMVRYDR